MFINIENISFIVTLKILSQDNLTALRNLIQIIESSKYVNIAVSPYNVSLYARKSLVKKIIASYEEHYMKTRYAILIQEKKIMLPSLTHIFIVNQGGCIIL